MSNLIGEWLDCQEPFSTGAAFKTNSPESLARREAMLQLKSALEAQISEAGLILDGESIQVEISKGMGVDTSIPYVRFFNSKTPKATKGWSLVLFANENANSISMSIGLGVYEGAKKRDTIKYTDKLLMDSNIPKDLQKRLEIGTSNRASSYEAACPLSKDVTREQLVSLQDQDFLEMLKIFLSTFSYVLGQYPTLEPASPSEKVTGNWLLQFNPGIWDFDSAISDGVRDFSFRIGNFKNLVEVGDSIAIWRSGSRPGVVAVGRVMEAPEDLKIDDTTASYFKIEYDKNLVETRIFVHLDEIFDNYVSKSDLAADLAHNNIFRAPQSTSPFILTDSEFESIMAKAGLAISKKKSIEALSDDLLVSAEWLRDILNELLSKKQVILQGPPGTGKTFMAQAIAEHISDGSSLVQFHPSYSYEDFVEGFRPVKHGDSFGFELKPGPLVSLANEARSRPDKKFVLIIDEINRGNLAKVFGEMYFLLEYRDSEVTMQYRTYGETFSLPPNLYFIGTMNTADRSISSLDMAIRRRFSFIDLNPATDPLKILLPKWLDREGVNPKIADLLDYVNSFIQDDRLKLGPSYFMKKNVQEELPKIWEYQILPQLKEIFFDNSEMLEALAFSAVAKATNFD